MEKEKSSDMDLPFELQDPNPKSTFDVEKLEKGNVVWAARKDLHWPALVRSIDKKNKKVKVWYLDTPGKSFKVAFKKIEEFEDLEFNKKVLKAAKLNPLCRKHHAVFRRSLLFLFRRSTGIKDNPAVFFDTSKPYILLRESEHGNSELKITSDNTSSEGVDDNLAESESLVESEEENHSITKSVPELCVENSSYSDEVVNKILSCIKAGQVDKHLMDVVNSKIVNERHDLFVEAVKTCKTELLLSSPSYIPIVNIEKLQNISLYLSNLYEQKMGKDTLLMSEYVISVWLPEAVDKALSLIKTESLEQPVCEGNVSDLSLEAEVKEKIPEAVDEAVSLIKTESLEQPVCESNISDLSLEAEVNEKIPEAVDKAMSLIKTESLEQPVCEGNVSDLSLEAEVKEKINESSSLKVSSEIFTDPSKSTVNCGNKVYNQPMQEQDVETQGKSEQQPIACGSKASTISPRYKIEVVSLLSSDSEDSDSTIEILSSECNSPAKPKSDENNKEAAVGEKRKDESEPSTPSKKQALEKINQPDEDNVMSSPED